MCGNTAIETSALTPPVDTFGTGCNLRPNHRGQASLGVQVPDSQGIPDLPGTRCDRRNGIGMHLLRKTALAALTGLGLAFLGACSPIIQQEGNVPDPDQVVQINPGVDDK